MKCCDQAREEQREKDCKTVCGGCKIGSPIIPSMTDEYAIYHDNYDKLGPLCITKCHAYPWKLRGKSEKWDGTNPHVPKDKDPFDYEPGGAQ